MSIRIDKEKCTGCRQCIELCPGNLIKWNDDEGHAYMRRPSDCWGCASCIKVCPADAVRYFLGADIGGAGCEMTVSYKKDANIWHFHYPDGTLKEITVDPRSSNKY